MMIVEFNFVAVLIIVIYLPHTLIVTHFQMSYYDTYSSIHTGRGEINETLCEFEIYDTHKKDVFLVTQKLGCEGSLKNMMKPP